MSDIDPTPDTPTTIGDRMGWWRGDVAARLATLEAQVAALAGTPASTLATLAGQLGNIEGQWAHGSGIRPYDLLDLIYQQNAGAWAHGSGIRPYDLLDLIYQQQVEIQARLDKLQAGLGAEPYNSLELASVRGLLYALLTNAQAFGITPGYSSDTTVTASTYAFDGKRYIIWPTIDGLNRAGNDDIPLGAIIFPVTNWEGYQIYIKSDAPVAFSGTIEFPVNSWFTLSGADAYSFWVDSQYQAAGYIKSPTPALCLLSPVAVRYSINGDLKNFYGLQWPDNLGYDVRNTSIGGDVYSPINFLVGDFTGWTVKIDRTQNITVQNINFTTKNQQLTIPGMANTPYLYAYSTAPFQIRLCPADVDNPDFS